MSITIRDYHNTVKGETQGKKKYGRKKLLKEFPEKNWSETGLQNLLNKIDDTEDTKRKQGSRRQRKPLSDANIDTVET